MLDWIAWNRTLWSFHFVETNDKCLIELLARHSVVFWPSARANMPLQSDTPEGSDTFQWPVIEIGRVGGLSWWNGTRLKIPWYTHRLTHRKRVTSELHDSYFRLMTIKHAIPKIEWAIEWALNCNIAQSRQKSDSWRRSYRRGVAGKATSGRRGPWGPRWVGVQRSWWQDVVEKASTQQKAESPGLRLSSPGERERHNADGHKSGGQNIAVSVRSPAPSHTQTLEIQLEVHIC